MVNFNSFLLNYQRVLQSSHIFPVGPSALGYRTPWLAAGRSPRGAAVESESQKNRQKGLRAMRKFMEIWSNLWKFMEKSCQI
jgi:hypothetical protein